MLKETHAVVLNCRDPAAAGLSELLARYGLEMVWVNQHEAIPGSYWGEQEAGLIANRLYLQAGTPLHSALHEACHYICMDPARRSTLDTNAAGDYAEENAVCYLQIVLAAALPLAGSQRMQQDMDTWGYTFRLGSAHVWFAQDAEEAQAWLLQHKIIDNRNQPTWHLRG